MGEKYRVNAACFRYVVSFHYEEPFEKACDKIEDQTRQIGKQGKIISLWNRRTIEQDRTESDLYSYVRDEFRFDHRIDKLSDCKDGCEWLYWNSEESKEKNGKKIKKLVCSIGNREVNIMNVGLYLFRNGVGFIWYEMEISQDTDSEQLKKIQNEIRELNRSGNSCLKEQILERELPEDAKDAIYYKGDKPGYRTFLLPFSMGEWINELLSGVLRVTYFAERKSTSHTYPYAPDKAILFTYASFDSKDEEKNDNGKYELSYHLTSGYTDSYHYSQEIRREMKQPFDNVIWNATQEGVSYLAWPGEDNIVFFQSTLPGKIKRDYFTLFIKVLYQSFSLLLYAEKIQRGISCIRREYEGNPEDNSITKLCGEINLFLTKSMATSVSHIHHQSEFYTYLKRQFRVDEDVKSVTAGLDALESLLREDREREEDVRIQNEWKEEQRRDSEERKEREDREIRERQRESKTQAIMGLFALLGITSALVDGFDFVTKFVEADKWSELTYDMKIIECVVIGIIALVGAIAICFAVKTLKDAFQDGDHLVTRMICKLKAAIEKNNRKRNEDSAGDK